MTKTQASVWMGLIGGVILAGMVASVQQPLDVRVPTGAIAHFDRTTATGCPVGWTELTGARGAYLVGLTSGGTKGTLVGTALSNQENRTHTHPVPSHDHPMPHTHPFSATTGGANDETSKRDIDVLTVADDDHTHPFPATPGTSGASTVASSSAASSTSGNQSAMIAPYLQYLVCRRG